MPSGPGSPVACPLSTRGSQLVKGGAEALVAGLASTTGQECVGRVIDRSWALLDVPMAAIAEWADQNWLAGEAARDRCDRLRRASRAWALAPAHSGARLCLE